MSESVALVTGATSGIGETIVRRLAAEGSRVLATGRSIERGERLANELGPAVRFAPADLRADDAADELVRIAVESFGRLDTLVNNAAADHTGNLLEIPMAEIREIFEINAIAPLRMLQAAARAMKGTGGSIINITSRLASVGVPTMALYSASKGALLSLTRAAAVELAPDNIRVNAVAPGMTRTRLYDEWIAAQSSPGSVEAEVVSAIPLRRLAVPGDVAGAVVYLASPEAAYVTGISLPVDGGYTAQ